MRIGIAAALTLAAAASFAQTPDVAIFADVRPTISWGRDQDAQFRWFDLNGRHSLVGFRLVAESNARIYVAQRLQQMEGDSDSDGFDEAYIELPPEWRVGKQYIPFGARNIIRESVLGVRFNTELVFDSVPAEFAYVDGGEGRPRGAVVRVGGPIFGASLATGENFGIQGTSFAQFRDPDLAAGKGHGYSLMYGADVNFRTGVVDVSAEYVALRIGETDSEADGDLTDIKGRVSLLGLGWIEAGWARDWDAHRNVMRIMAEVPTGEHVILAPFVRFDDDGFRDIGVSARIRF
jgi:hypothetical protein